MSLPQTARDLPPSAKLAYRTLEREGEMTQKELRSEVYLPETTAREALDTLECHDLIRVEASTQDGRQQIYRVE